MSFFKKNLPAETKKVGQIEQLARASKTWQVIGKEAGRYEIVSTDHRRPSYISIRASDRPSVVFQLFFNIRFSLEKTPHLLFARFMMRSHELTWCSWVAYIGESTEAVVYLFARVPKSALDDRLFQAICEEMRTEAQAFEKELSDKFDYLRGFRPQSSGSSGVPMPRQGGNDVRFYE